MKGHVQRPIKGPCSASFQYTTNLNTKSVYPERLVCQQNIPTKLETLSFLSVLNLSFNHLVGKIATCTQLQSLPASSFQGNDGLYDPPLTKELDPRQPRMVQEHETLISTIE